MTKILVISNNDPVWLLPTWAEFVKYSHLTNVEVNFILVPDTLKKMSRQQSVRWAFATFGWKQASLLSLYSVIRQFKYRHATNSIRTQAEVLSTFDCEQIKRNMRAIKFDAVIITCSNKIPSDLLSEFNIPWINKHSSLLPSYKGLFPYIRAFLNDAPQGFTFHLVSKDFDSGDVLLQSSTPTNRSMVDFYNTVYSQFPENCHASLKIALGNASRITIKTQLEPSYFSLPSRKVLRTFYNLKGEIITFEDLLNLVRIYSR